MITATKAGTLYALIVFLIGFIFGTVRVLLVVPRLGETAAVLLEISLILTGSWFVCRWCVERLDVVRSVGPRSLMGVVAFLVLISAEFALAVWLFGRPMAQQLFAYRSTIGAIRIAAQVVFATFPILQ